MFVLFCDGSARQLGIVDKGGRVNLQKLRYHTKYCHFCRQEMKKLKVVIIETDRREKAIARKNKDLLAKRHRSKTLA